MVRRDFTELDLRKMLEHALRVRPDHEEGRYVVETTRRGRPWTIVVEPDAEEGCVLVVTAYPVEDR